jgi:DNA-binding winged helix-turn-helix (wHTH) protein
MAPDSAVHFGPFLLDDTDDSLWHGSERCHLTAKAMAVLCYLVAHPGRLVRKADLLAAVWPDTHVSDWVLTTCIRELRHVLGDMAKTPRYIATVHRQGYRFIAPVTRGATSPQPPRAVPADVEGPPLLPRQQQYWRRNTSWSPSCAGRWPRRPPWRHAWSPSRGIVCSRR